MPSVNSTMFTMSNYSVYFLMEQNTLQDYFSHQYNNSGRDFVPGPLLTPPTRLPDSGGPHPEPERVGRRRAPVDARLQKQPLQHLRQRRLASYPLLYMIPSQPCWMSSPVCKVAACHKRKPLLTHLATVMYSVVLTIILAQITAVSRDEYYSDTLDMIKILNIVNDKRKYPTAITISQLLTNLALVHPGGQDAKRNVINGAGLLSANLGLAKGKSLANIR
ncbi:hypothetical protein E0198_004785 [Clavispora lusitaniae]|nr:hypothetical protein E0198_004785 [Clavispora lusitaniae]